MRFCLDSNRLSKFWELPPHARRRASCPWKSGFALSHPEFSIYLGRKAFAASFPFYLGVGDASLLTQLPALARNEQKITNGKVSVKLYQHALGQAAAPAQTMVPAARSRAQSLD